MILPATREEIEYAGKILSYHPSAQCKGIKQVRGNRILSIVLYDHWTLNAVQMHVWLQSPRALTRDFIRECFRYPFEICGRGLVIGVTPGDNRRALDFNRHLGFTEISRVKDGWDLGTDMVIQELRRENCRWLGGNHDSRIFTEKSNGAAGGRSPQSDHGEHRTSLSS